LIWEEAVGLQVLLVGRLRPELGVTGSHEGVAVADIRHPDAVQDAVERLSGRAGTAGELDAGGTDPARGPGPHPAASPGPDPVMVVCSVADTAEVRRQLDLLHVALPGVRTLLEPVAGSPLAVAVIAALVGDTDGTRDAAGQLAMLDTLRDRTWSATWLPRVHKLDHPQPSLTQHVRGWLGGSGFLAVHSTPGESGPRVTTCTGAAVPTPSDTPAEGVLMVADSGSPDWVVPAFTTAVGIGSRTDYATWRDPRDAFGVTACAEFLIVPADLDDPEALDVATAECPGCGHRHHRTTCPYCRMTRPPEAEAAAVPDPDDDRADPDADRDDGGGYGDDDLHDDLQGAPA
jgi:hypothetical protein